MMFNQFIYHYFPTAIMVRVLSSQFIFLLVFSFSATNTKVEAKRKTHDEFVRAMDPMMRMREKLSHLRFYWHDIVSGQNPSSIQIVNPPSNTSATAFGLTRIIDNPLTLGPKLSSKIVGRAQGFYASASQLEISLIMVMNFAFIQGKYNGSTITVLGRNPVFSKMREMPVIGGSGTFRFARGYAQATTNKVNLQTGDAIVEYNVFVLHY